MYNAANQTLSTYVNGTLDNGTLSGIVPSSQSNSSVNVNIGRRSPGAYGGFYFNGIIDEVRIYNRALTQAEIQTDMNTPLAAPTPPVLATPANGATGVAANPTLTWNASTGATSYRVQVSTDPAFETTLVDQSNITTTSYALSALVANTTYYWHVNAANSVGTSAYSTARNFTTAVLGTAPLVTGVEALLQDASVNIAWKEKGPATRKVRASSALAHYDTGPIKNVLLHHATTLTVSALGQGHLSYRWQRDGADIPGANTPSFTLRVGNSTRFTATLRCIVSNSFGADTTSEAIVSLVPPSIELIAPHQGESWVCNSLQDLTWLSSGVDRVNIEYRMAHGEGWIPIAQNVPASKGVYTWMLPSKPVSAARLRIVDAENQNTLDSSDADLDITLPDSRLKLTPQPKGIVASVSGRGLELIWLTPAKRILQWIEIQKSKSPDGAFESILRVDDPQSAEGLAKELFWINVQTEMHRYGYTERHPEKGSWYYRVKEVADDGAAYYSESVLADAPINVVERPVPVQYSLDQNYPNPFNPTTTISFGLPQAGHVKLEVFNVLGERVATLLDEEHAAGFYAERFSALSLPSGVYLYRVQAGDFMAHKKMLLLK